MKKTCKRLGAIFLAMAMAVSVLCTGAMAADTYAISTNTDDTHTYSVYQIFTGTLAKDGKTLSDIKWGQNGKNGDSTVAKGDAVPQDVLDALTAVKDSTSNKDKLAVIKKYVNLDGDAYGTVSKDTSLSVPAGYYLIKDSTEVTGNDAATNYIVSVVNNVTIERKTGVPEVDKTVNNESAATANIGDEVEFKLFATLPSNYEDYTSYNLVFNDILSKGLTLTEDELNALTVKVYTSKENAKSDTNGVELKKSDTNGYKATKANGNDGQTKLEVSFTDLKKAQQSTGDNTADIKNGYVVVVTYKATLNKDAEIGNTIGNKNTVNLTYSNDPNDTSEGTTTDKDVTVYTFQLDVSKIAKKTNNDDADKPLAGAVFELYRLNGTTKEYAQVTDGKLTGWTQTESKATKLTTGDDGKISVAGLKNDTYYLKEITAPDGYNLLTADVTVVISNDNTNVGTLTGVTSTSGVQGETDTTNGTVVANTGIATIKIANAAGSQLPSTGGMGTTLFYVIGGALMAGAAIVLVIKKKRSSAE